MNKRGIFFTLLSILIISLFFLSYSAHQSSDEMQSLQKRVETMNTFLFSLEKDVSRQIFISGFRGLLSLSFYITSSGNFLDDASKSLEEALVNGTVNDEKMSLMEGFTLEDWNARIKDLADKQNLIVNYTIESVSVTQGDPWNVEINVGIHLIVRDEGNLALFDKKETISTKIPIENFEDSLYLIETNGLIVNKIQKSPYTDFVSGNDVSNLSLHSENSYYIESSDAPSFLDRLEGKTTSNTNGIESLVNLPKFAEQGVTIKEKSVVDHIYFSDNNPTSYQIQGMPSWFRIDVDHLDVYNVSNLTI